MERVGNLYSPSPGTASTSMIFNRPASPEMVLGDLLYMSNGSTPVCVGSEPFKNIWYTETLMRIPAVPTRFRLRREPTPHFCVGSLHTRPPDGGRVCFLSFPIRSEVHSTTKRTVYKYDFQWHNIIKGTSYLFRALAAYNGSLWSIPIG